MVKSKPKPKKSSPVEVPADYRLRPEEYTDAEIMTGEGRGRAVVKKRKVQIERLHARGLISHGQLAALEAYRDAVELARYDTTACCLRSFMPSYGGQVPFERMASRRAHERRLKSAIPQHCASAVHAVVVENLAPEFVAWSRVPRQRAAASRYVLGLRARASARPERVLRVVAELREAGDNLLLVIKGT